MAVHAQANCTLNTIPAKTSLLGGHFIYNGASATQTTPASANVIENAVSNPSQWGYNTHIGANGIKLRNNETTLSEWNTNELSFYVPSGTYAGKKAMGLNGTSLTFYNINSTNAAAAELSSAGLILSSGGIIAGNYTTNPTNFIYLSTEDYSGSPTITINGNSAGWRQVIGTKFGVKNDGTLYASGGKFNGTIEATDGYIANSVTIGSGGTTLATIDQNTKIYQIGGNGTAGYHFLGTLKLNGQADEADIEIHTGDGQNNSAYQNLTIRVNIKRGWQGESSGVTDATAAGITVRYENDPTIVTSQSDFQIKVTCTNGYAQGLFNVYLYSTKSYTDGWYQVRGRGYTWTHSGAYGNDATPIGVEQTNIRTMNPYTAATNYLNFNTNDGLTVGYTGENNKINIKGDGMTVYANNVDVAKFGTSARIGSNTIDGYRTEVSSGGIDFIRRSSGADNNAVHIGNDSGGNFYYSFGARGTGSIGSGSFSANGGNVASGYNSFAEGDVTTASGESSHAEGMGTIARGDQSHAEGYETEAKGDYSHTEGYASQTTVDGLAAHVEGSNTIASNNDAHAEGENTQASGANSHAQNDHTIAQGRSQTAIGKYNKAQGSPSSIANTDYAFIIGNGTSSTRSDALTVDWSGNVNIASGAKYKINGTNLSASDVGALASSDVYGMFSVSGVTIASADSLAAGDYKTYTYTYARSGYYPLCVARINSSGSNSTFCSIIRYGLTSQSVGSCDISVTVRNVASSSAATLTLAVYVLWVKTT